MVDFAAASTYLIVRGSIDLANNQTSFAPFGSLTTDQPPPLPSPGTFLLRALDANNTVLTEVPFTPNRLEAEFPEPDTSRATFIIPIPHDPAIRSVVVLNGGQVIATKTASANPPNVTVLAPNGGQSITSNPVTFQWIGSDPDGDPLTYVVQYSANNGVTWTTLAVDWQAQTYQPDYSSLPASPQGRIRVIASDGFRTASDESDAPFTVANHAPDVLLRTPSDQQLFLGKQQIICDASVHDVEDGDVSNQKIQWRSDLDGVLGNGNVLLLAASNLSEGIHRLTVAATDNSGATTEKSVTVVVTRAVPEKLADLAVSQTSQATGDGLTFTLTVENLGPTSATGLKVTDELPAGVTVLSATSAAGNCTVVNGQVTCSIGQLAAGATATVTLQLAITTPGTYTNLADVKGLELDPILANNLAVDAVDFAAPTPQLRIELVGNLLRISWPTSTPANVLLRSSPSLSPPVWSDVTDTPVVENNRFTVTHSLTSTNRFYRLEPR